MAHLPITHIPVKVIWIFTFVVRDDITDIPADTAKAYKAIRKIKQHPVDILYYETKPSGLPKKRRLSVSSLKRLILNSVYRLCSSYWSLPTKCF